MTDQQIIEKLATEFFGWQFTDDVQVIGEHSRTDITTTIWFRSPSGRVGVAGAVTCRDFDPLTDPAACALVLDEIERRGWAYVLYYEPLLPKPFRFQLAQKVGEFRAASNNRYRAVCLAVLRVCEKEQAA